MYCADDDEVLEALKSKEQPAPILQKIFEGLADDASSLELLNRYQAGNPHYARGYRAGQWFETTQETYWYFLECLPPLYMTGAAFVVIECTMNGLYDCFFEIDGRYYCAPVEWDGPGSFKALSKAMRAEVGS
jgi:hypothetical protein